MVFVSIDLVVEEIENFLTYKIQNCESLLEFELFKEFTFNFTGIADVGGLLGLFLGCSLLSLVEVLYLIISAMTKAIKKKDHIKSIRKVTVDPDIIKLKEDVKSLSIQFEMLSSQLEQIVKNELLIRVARLEHYETESSQKISNLEKNDLIVTDL